ncbi:MAG: glycosyl hydrolase, partial [Chitinophagaceae bacterium]|nr:glycosyl hydrolase [Chitinophagaceae bacterium]
MYNHSKSLLNLCAVSAALSLVTVFSSCNSVDTTATKTDTLTREENKEEGFVSLFDGKTLNGCDGDTAFWRVEYGALTGQVTRAKALKTNTFLIWRGGT